MPINRNTLLRYKTIDRMLQRGRKATLEELIDACNDALYETNGYGEVSRRTIQHDIQEMRYSQALGYYAPIVMWTLLILPDDMWVILISQGQTDDTKLWTEPIQLQKVIRQSLMNG